MPDLRIITRGLTLGESPRWHGGRLWCANWGAGEVLAVDDSGQREVMLRAPHPIPFSIDWLPNGRLLIVSGAEARLLRQQPDGSLVMHADLRPLARGWNEIVVDVDVDVAAAVAVDQRCGDVFLRRTTGRAHRNR